MKAWPLLLLPLAVVAIAAARADDAALPSNVVAALEAKQEKGEVKLTYEPDGHGYLRSVLAALKAAGV